MSEFLTEFHFMRPYFLVLLIIPIIFYLKYFKGDKNQSAWEKVCDKKLLKYLLIEGSAKTRRTISYILLIAFISCTASHGHPTMPPASWIGTMHLRSRMSSPK